ncbi:hypothetical protein C1T17_02510 [Sphingobium sp. SCG-1]|uniref:MFS transporter n=1 Tax=Sphingobium sp. SCG-1 TaxID=2072936 RepID=UPI000CD684A5|nr:MFS transporter [Sphingobium sp. SCG-1]AUW57123.1 hypothetical protein C1T17_02510 [Sphingobium sp. SCG-1]
MARTSEAVQALENSGSDNPKMLRGKAALMMLATLVIAELAATFETSMIIAGMKQLLVQFERPVAIGWLLTSYLLVASGSAALGGRMGDLFGRRTVLMISLGFAITGSLISAVSHSLEGIIAGRAIQGLSGGILPLCVGLLRENLSMRRVPLGVGIISSTAAAGAGGGLVLGGLLVDYGHWSLIFYCSALTAAIAMVLMPFTVPKSKPQISFTRNADLIAGALFMPPIAIILLALSNISNLGWLDGRIWTGIAVAAAALVLWARHELSHPNPLIDVRLLAYRPILSANICMIFLAMSGMAFAQFLILMVQQPVASGVGLGVTATVAGLIKLPGNIVSTITAPVDGQLVAHFGGRAIIVAGGLIAGLGLLGFIFFSQHIVAVICLSVLVTGGSTMMLVAAPNIIIQHAPEHRTSEAIGVMTVLRSVFMAIGVQMTMVPLAFHTRPGSPYPAHQGFIISLTLLALMSAMAAVTALIFLRPKGMKPAPPITA